MYIFLCVVIVLFFGLYAMKSHENSENLYKLEKTENSLEIYKKAAREDADKIQDLKIKSEELEQQLYDSLLYLSLEQCSISELTDNSIEDTISLFHYYHCNLQCKNSKDIILENVKKDLSFIRKCEESYKLIYAYIKHKGAFPSKQDIDYIKLECMPITPDTTKQHCEIAEQVYQNIVKYQ